LRPGWVKKWNWEKSGQMDEEKNIEPSRLQNQPSTPPASKYLGIQGSEEKLERARSAQVELHSFRGMTLLKGGFSLLSL
jgi:hypothetical protein